MDILFKNKFLYTHILKQYTYVCLTRWACETHLPLLMDSILKLIFRRILNLHTVNLKVIDRVQDIKPLGFLILVFYISQVCSHIYVNNNVCVKWFDGKGRQYNTVMSIRKNSFFSNFIMVICQFYIITHNTALVMTCFIMILTWTPVTASENMYLLPNDYYIVS